YVATSTDSSNSAIGDLGVDPKDTIKIANLTDRANFLVEEESYQAAVPLLQQLVAQEPDAPVPYSKLGRSYTAMKEYDKAVLVLHKLVDLKPDSSDAHFQLAVALLGTQDFAAATQQLEIVVEKEPRGVQPHLMLATAYAKTNRSREAVTECEKVLEVAPKHYGALLLEGRILVLSKHPES